jgi:uncharacterized membrane protein
MSVRGTSGLPSNIAAAIAYAFGALSVIAMLMIERRDPFVRFHAWQSTLTFLGALAASLLVSSFPFVGRLLNLLLTAGLAALWILLIVKALNHERFKLPYVGEFAERQVGDPLR